MHVTSTPLALGSGINHVKRKGKMKCTECGLALKREGIKGEKRKGKSRGSLSFPSLSNLLFFPSLSYTLDACDAGQFLRVTKGQIHDKRENQAWKVRM